MACQQYANDNREKFPYDANNVNDPHVLLYPYMGKTDWKDANGNPVINGFHRFVPNVFYCPSEKHFGDPWTELFATYYGLNLYLNDPAIGMNRSKVRFSDVTVLYGDKVESNGTAWAWPDYYLRRHPFDRQWNYTPGTPWTGTGEGSTNYVFGDGHAETIAGRPEKIDLIFNVVTNVRGKWWWLP